MDQTQTMLNGCAVRDIYGAVGRVVGLTNSAVDISWAASSSALPRVERISRKDDRLKQAVEVLTLDRGWCAMAEVVGIQESAGRYGDLLAELKSLLEVKGFRYPFKRKGSIGLGPRKGRNRARSSEPWECSCSNYKCTCISGKGRNKRRRKIRISRGYKHTYNKEYKAWSRAKRKKK